MLVGELKLCLSYVDFVNLRQFERKFDWYQSFFFSTAEGYFDYLVYSLGLSLENIKNTQQSTLILYPLRFLHTMRFNTS